MRWIKKLRRLFDAIFGAKGVCGHCGKPGPRHCDEYLADLNEL